MIVLACSLGYYVDLQEIAYPLKSSWLNSFLFLR